MWQLNNVETGSSRDAQNTTEEWENLKRHYVFFYKDYDGLDFLLLRRHL